MSENFFYTGVGDLTLLLADGVWFPKDKVFRDVFENAIKKALHHGFQTKDMKPLTKMLNRIPNHKDKITITQLVAGTMPIDFLPHGGMVGQFAFEYPFFADKEKLFTPEIIETFKLPSDIYEISKTKAAIVINKGELGIDDFYDLVMDGITLYRHQLSIEQLESIKAVTEKAIEAKLKK